MADHAGDVAVAEHRHVLLQLDHETVIPDLGQMRNLARADSGSRHRDALATGDHGHADQFVEVLCRAAGFLLDDDSALGGEGRPSARMSAPRRLEAVPDATDGRDEDRMG